MSDLLILYGSQTGNAEDAAQMIEYEAQRRHYTTQCLAADAYDVLKLPTEKFLVIVVSTTGQGDAPYNITSFWKFLRRKSLPENSLAGLSIAVFGLGDSGYPKYNIMAKLIYRRLLALGAHCLCDTVGLGDDQEPTGYEGALDSWLPQLWKGLRLRCPLSDQLVEPPIDDISPDIPLPKYGVHFVNATGGMGGANNDINSIKHDENECFLIDHTEAIEAAAAFEALHSRSTSSSASQSQISSSNSMYTKYTSERPWMAQIKQNERITAEDHFQDVRLIELDLEGSGILFEPGDVLAMWPRQPDDAVIEFCQRCRLDPHATVEITLKSPLSKHEQQHGFHDTATTNKISVNTRALVSGVLDINGASPRRSFFSMLARFATAPHEVERLRYFSSSLGRDDLHEYNRREGRTVLEILNDFPSVQPPLDWLLQYAPRLQPRRFSIASSLRWKPGVAQLLVAIVDWVTPNKRRKRGVVTQWLAKLQPGDASSLIPVWIEKGALRMPKSLDTPMIMIGPGTGVAPFRSFIQDRMAITNNEGIAPSILVFGCRNKSGDCYCESEWEEAKRCGVLDDVITAFSRDIPSKKVYVTHKIRQHGAEIWKMISEQQGAAIYIAGSADKMPADVGNALKEVAVTHGGLSKEEADAWRREMEAQGRYQTEAWS